jgi:gp16 family phage-associated protein
VKTKTLDQVRAEFTEAGVSVAEWARVNGFTRETVVDVLRGQSKGLRGEAHRAAVALGLKSGHVTPAAQFHPAARKGGEAIPQPQPEGTAPMNGILYRALAARLDTPFALEVYVFFECPPLLNPATEAARLLAAVWWTHPDHIDLCNVVTEHELFTTWNFSDSAATGDARLFEIGIGDAGRVHYMPPERALFLVSGSTLQRLAKAQRVAGELSAAGYSVDVPQPWSRGRKTAAAAASNSTAGAAA